MNYFMELPYFHILLVMFLSSSGKQQASTEDETYKTLLLVSSFQEYGWQNLWVDISLSDQHYRNEVVTTLQCLFLVIQDNMDHQCRFYMLTSGLYIREGVLCLHLNICFNIGKKMSYCKFFASLLEPIKIKAVNTQQCRHLYLVLSSLLSSGSYLSHYV
jgi:hypothetical protein